MGEEVTVEQWPDRVPVAETDRGTPVYHIDFEVPAGLMPDHGSPSPQGEFTRWLLTQYRAPCCVIVKQKRRTRIYKLNLDGWLFPVTARSIKIEDRKRLAAEGILKT